MKSRYIVISAASLVTAAAVLGSVASLTSAASGGPTVTLTSTEASSTSAASIPVTATFSEAVGGLASSSITATNATVGDVSGSGTTFTFNITPVSQGTVTVMVAADAASSTASSTGNQVSNMLSFQYAPASTTPTTTTAFLSLSAYSGGVGTSFNALGSSFSPNEQVALAFGGATTTATADSAGSFSKGMTVPNSLPIGPATITATGQTSGRIATNSFFVNSTSTSTATSTASTTPLALTGIDTVKGNAIADGSFSDGWEWVLHLTVPDNETHFAMKFGDFAMGSSSSSTIPAKNNIRIFSPQSQNASTTGSSLLETDNDYSADMMLGSDKDAGSAGRQIDVHVQVAVPSGTPAGTYSSTFGALSTTTPF